MTNSNDSEKSPDQKVFSRYLELSQKTKTPVKELRKSEWRGCMTKRDFDTEWEATVEAARGRDVTGHDNIEAYKCLWCSMWHIGHQGKSHLAKRKGIKCPACRAWLRQNNYLNHIRWHKATHPGIPPKLLAKMQYSWDHRII